MTNIIKSYSSEPEFLPNNILLERAKDLFSRKIKETLKYINKKSNNKWISLIKENPLTIQITQNNKKRIISIKSFTTLIEVKKIIEQKSLKNYNFFKEAVKNRELLKVLKIFDKWKWEKIYIKNHKKNIEIHYFQSENWLIYDLKIKT